MEVRKRKQEMVVMTIEEFMQKLDLNAFFDIDNIKIFYKGTDGFIEILLTEKKTFFDLGDKNE